MKAFIYLCLFLLSANIYADEYRIKCKLAGSQIELNACAYDNFVKADKKLNETYQTLIKKSGNKNYIQKLRKSQRAWVKFRDAELELMFACDDKDMRICWGSMFGMLHPAAKQKLTEERAKRLQHYIDHGQNVSVGEGG